MKKPEPTLVNMLAKFRTYLLGRRLTDGYCKILADHVRNGWGDPVGYVANRPSFMGFGNARMAWIHWSNWTGSEEIERELRKLVAPRRLPVKVRVPPGDSQLRAAAEDAAGLPLPWGPVLWIVYLSGLRIREVCRLTRVEAQDALRRPEITVLAKGAGGFARRTWVAGGLVRMALAALLRLPWREVWVLASTDPTGAAGILRTKCHGGFRPHDFRHGVARVMRSIRDAAGRRMIPTETISAVLGHDLTGVQGTTAIYAPPSAAEIEEAHGLLAAYLWPGGIPAPAGSWLEAGGLPAPRAPADVG